MWWWLFPRMPGLWEECSTIHSPLVLFFFFLSGDSLSHTNSTLLGRISPQWLSELRRLWPSVPWWVACELVSWYLSTLCLDSGIVSPLRLHWVKGVRVFRCNLPPALLLVWQGSFTCHCSNMEVEETPNKSQHTKLTQEKKIFPPLLPGFEPATFRSRVQRSRLLNTWTLPLVKYSTEYKKMGRLHMDYMMWAFFFLFFFFSALWNLERIVFGGPARASKLCRDLHVGPLNTRIFKGFPSRVK